MPPRPLVAHPGVVFFVFLDFEKSFEKEDVIPSHPFFLQIACSVIYLPEALQCKATVTLGSQRLWDEKGAKDPNEEKEECTNTATKNWNKTYYTEAIKASNLHNLLKCHHGANGKSVYMPVGDIPKIED